MRFARCARGGTMNGQSIVIKGEISGAEDLVIAGRVEGKINLDGCVLTLAPGSEVIGEVSAGTLIVSGRIEGVLLASKRLEARATAIIEGELTTPVLLVAEGANICAQIDMPARERKPQLAVAV
jgi:cytoskeletal protein CcmA (bactofilin family)